MHDKLNETKRKIANEIWTFVAIKTKVIACILLLLAQNYLIGSFLHEMRISLRNAQRNRVEVYNFESIFCVLIVIAFYNHLCVCVIKAKPMEPLCMNVVATRLK